MAFPITIPAPNDRCWEFRVEPEDDRADADFVAIAEWVGPHEQGDTLYVHSDQAEALAEAVLDSARAIRARKGA